MVGYRQYQAAVAVAATDADECEREIQHQRSHCSRPSIAVELGLHFTLEQLLLGWDYEIGNLFIFQFANSVASHFLLLLLLLFICPLATRRRC